MGKISAVLYDSRQTEPLRTITVEGPVPDRVRDDEGRSFVYWHAIESGRFAYLLERKDPRRG